MNVYSQNGALLAVLDHAGEPGYSLKHNDLWTGTFKLPAGDPKNTYCQAHNMVKLPDGPRETGLYRIIGMPSDEVTTAGGFKVYSLEHVMATLLDDILFGYHEVGGTGYTTRMVMEYILARQTVQRWQLGVVEFSDEYQYHFENVPLLSALLSLGEVLTEEYTWDFDTSTTPWTVNLRKADSATGCGIYYGRNLVSIEKSMDASALVTRLYPLGYGEGVNQLTIKSVNNGVPYIDADTIATWGVKCNVWTDTRIEDAGTLLAKARQVLEGYKNPYLSYTAKAVDLYRLTGFSWDNFMPGKLVQVMDGEHNITFQARIVEISKKDAQGDPGNIEITIANAPRDTADSINALANRVGIGELYSQGATNLFAIPFADNADENHPAKMRIFISSGMVRINQMLLSWQLSPFRAYETGAAAGGSTEQTSSSGGGNTYTSSSGGGDTYTSSSGGGNTYTSSSGGGNTYTSSSGGGDTYTSTDGGGNTYTSSSGGGDTYTSSSGGGDTYTSNSGGSSTQTSSSGGGDTYTSNGGGGNTYTSSSGGGDTYTSSSGGSSTVTSENSNKKSITSNSGGGTTQTSASGGGETVTSEYAGYVSKTITASGAETASDHGESHKHTVSGSETGYAHDGSHTHGMYHTHTFTISSHTHDVTTNSHTHSVTIPDHTHTVEIEKHTHDVAIPNHSHSVTIPDHSHSVTITSHTQGVVIPNHSHSVTIPDHSHSVTIPGHTHGVVIPDHSHSVTIPNHSHSVAIPDHSHSVAIPDHSHSVTIPNHTHSVEIPDHTHNVTIPDHTHGIVYGIYEGTTAQSVTIKVDGSTVPASLLDSREIDVTAYLAKDQNGKITRNSWHEIQIIPNRLTRIEANLFAQCFIQSVGGGDY